MPLLNTTKLAVNIAGLQMQVFADPRSAPDEGSALTSAIVLMLVSLEQQIADLQDLAAISWPRPGAGGGDGGFVIDWPPAIAEQLTRIHDALDSREEQRQASSQQRGAV